MRLGLAVARPDPIPAVTSPAYRIPAGCPEDKSVLLLPVAHRREGGDIIWNLPQQLRNERPKLIYKMFASLSSQGKTFAYYTYHKQI